MSEWMNDLDHLCHLFTWILWLVCTWKENLNNKRETTATIIITSSFERIVSSVSHFINRILDASARERISSTPYTLPFILIPVAGERYSSILWLVFIFFTVYLFLYTNIFIYLFRSFYCHYNLYALVRLLCCRNNVSPFRFRLRLYHLKFRFFFVLFCLFKCECVCTFLSFCFSFLFRLIPIKKRKIIEMRIVFFLVKFFLSFELVG